MFKYHSNTKHLFLAYHQPNMIMTVRKIVHPFVKSRLSCESPTNYPASVRSAVLFSKLPEEHFHRHWEAVHADLTFAAKGFKGVQHQALRASTPDEGNEGEGEEFGGQIASGARREIQSLGTAMRGLGEVVRQSILVARSHGAT